MKRFDPDLAGPFRVEWLVETDRISRDDHERAIAEKAGSILRAARFIGSERDEADAEVRVWVEAASGPACVSVTWEPGARAYGFHLLDETLRERLACIIFHDLPCIDADASDAQADEIIRATLAAIREAEADDPDDPPELPVHRFPVDPGVEP